MTTTKRQPKWKRITAQSALDLIRRLERTRGTKQQRAEWRRICDATMDGPWVATRDGNHHHTIRHEDLARYDYAFSGHCEPAEAAFVEAARVAMPALLNENARLRATIRGIAERYENLVASTDRSGVRADMHDPLVGAMRSRAVVDELRREAKRLRAALGDDDGDG